MILAIDVDYGEGEAHAAGVLFEDWGDAEPKRKILTTVSPINEYIPGQFYRRELPCIQEILKGISEPIDFIIVDGYVYLTDEKKPGLGKYLYDDLDGEVPVIGVAKSSFVNTPPDCEVFRGESNKPLYVTAAGVEKELAKDFIKSMHGEFRFPTLLKEVDSLCRSWR